MKIGTCLVTLLLTLAVQPAAAKSTFEREIDLFERWLAIGDGSVVADIGAGSGEYAIALSRAVGASGTVYATELGTDERVEIAAAAREAGATRVEVVEAKVDGTGLAPGSCDALFLRGVYHHLTQPEPFVRSLFETVRPGGRVAIVDFPPSFWLALWTPDGIPEDRGGHGITPELVIRELEAAGFVHLETREEWPSHNFFESDYGVLFERPQRPAAAPRSGEPHSR